MLFISRIVLGLIAASISIYSFITHTDHLFSIMFFFLAAMMFVTGLDEYKKNRKPMGILLFLVSGFVLIVSIYA